ncbi:hypothetical protein [Corallibacter sp.]|uniref:hypothetical protein n=1 Tax=Corallibacter sp. TaxID=2038084 RepID=UPI003AB78683
MDKDIQLYKTTYNKQLLIALRYFKKDLIEQSLNDFDEYYAFNNSLNSLYSVKLEIQKELPDFKPLFDEFYHPKIPLRAEKFLNIIPRSLKPKYHEIRNPNTTFLDFIEKIATANAYNEVGRICHNNNAIYRKIYELNRFDLFNTDEYKPLLENSDLYKKLWDGTYKEKPLEECIKKSDLLQISEYILPFQKKTLTKNNSLEQEITASLNFKIKAKYKEKFKNHYPFFTEHFINKDVVSQEAFEKVFFEDTNSHSETIKFYCNTTDASYLLFKLNKSIFQNLSLTNIEKSKKFISCDDKYLKQSNLSHSKKNVTYNYELLINDFIEKIK